MPIKAVAVTPPNTLTGTLSHKQLSTPKIAPSANHANGAFMQG
jgi:hypothetical protein